MSQLDHRRALLDLAYQLDRGEALSDEQRRFLAVVFYRIGRGEDANKVLGLEFGRGERLSDAIARMRMSMILHWVACRVKPDPSSDEKAMSIEKACALAVDTIVPMAKAVYPGADRRHYDAEYILHCWGKPEYAHMRSTERGWFDPDFPYSALPASVKDAK